MSANIFKKKLSEFFRVMIFRVPWIQFGAVHTPLPIIIEAVHTHRLLVEAKVDEKNSVCARFFHTIRTTNVRSRFGTSAKNWEAAHSELFFFALIEAVERKLRENMPNCLFLAALRCPPKRREFAR
jgi:hypothetical protein